MASETWFLEAIKDKPDFFVLVGHMPARGATAQWQPVFDAIRLKHPLVPIFIFGGHTHERDCVLYDDRSIALVPGCYMETIGFVSGALPDDGDFSPMNVSRRYLDANRRTYTWHTGTNHHNFDTELGLNISTSLLQLASELNISTPLGIAPTDYFLARYPYGHKNNLLTEWAEKVLPETVHDEKRHGPRVIIGNGGSLRADLFQGRFDRNDELTISPFKTVFLVTRMQAGFAKLIEPRMNENGATKLLPDTEVGSSPAVGGERHDLTDTERFKLQREIQDAVDRGRAEARQEEWVEYLFDLASASAGKGQMPLRGSLKKTLTLGYVTKDLCPGRGDDIEHIPVPHGGKQPDFIATPFPDVQDDEEIDVVVMDFSMDDFLIAVHDLDPKSNLTLSDFVPYAEGLKIDVLWGMYAQKRWRP